jgi:hypothetical protein
LFVLKSYLHSRHFLIKVETKYTELSSVNVSIPQGSVLGPLLYLFTVDLAVSSESTTVTFAADTAVLAMDNNPAIASHKLRSNLVSIQN